MTLLRWSEPSVWEPFRGLLGVGESGISFIPPADLIEDKNDVVLTLDVPGMRMEDFDIAITADALTVKGERKYERERKDGEIVRSERVYGSFQRSVLLPNAVDADRVKATYKDGVLEVRLPKTEAAKPKKIAVESV